MKKKLLYKLVSLGMAAAITCSFGLTACNNSQGGGTITGAKLSDVEFWQTYTTDKVFQDVLESDYYVKQAPVIDVTAIRGEAEAAQIIMTTGDKPVTSYDVTVSDLTATDGEGNSIVYPKENITVYHQKYIYVVGGEFYKIIANYPDCLVPFEKIKKVKENVIEKENNQGLYISFDVPQSQEPATYHGTVGITIGGETKNIDVTLDVQLGLIGEETNFLSCFQNKWHMDRGELDSTNEMLDAYNRKLFEYRLGCSNLLFRNQHTDREIAEYARYAAEYSKLETFAGYDIPLSDKTYNNTLVYGRIINGTSRDPEVLKKYFLAIAYAGLEAGVDTFEKAFIYGRDEPDLNNTADSIVQNDGYIIRHTKEDAIATLKADASIPSDKQELLNQICESLDGVPHVVTSSAYMTTVNFDLDEEDMVYCPEFQYIQDEETQAKYRMREDNDLWWYGCCEPDYPYPTYHLDDTVISARLLSWMQADYNIQGNLYWATDDYAGVNGENAPNNYAEDYYTGNNAARAVRTNGEGYLFYPGAAYGVYGPLPSVRLEQIRDGMEEADMIMAIKEVYESVSERIGVDFDEDTFMNYVYARMYSGTKVSTNSTVFATCRKILISLLNLAQSEAQACITDVIEEGTGYTFKIFVKDNGTLKTNGVVCTEYTQVEGGKIYTVNVNLTNQEKLNISVEVADKNYGLEMGFGSGMDIYGGQEIEDNFTISAWRSDNTVPSFSYETITVTEDISAQNVGETWIKFVFAESTANVKQSFNLSGNIVSGFNKNTDKVLFYIYNASDETVPLEFRMTNANSQAIRSGGKVVGYASSIYANVNLKPGMNTVALNNVYAFNWRDIKHIKALRFDIGVAGDNVARSGLYLASIRVYKA